MSWQVQEAKQRYSELLRRAHEEGPQSITRHGEEVGMVVDIQWFRDVTSTGRDLSIYLRDAHFEGFHEALDESDVRQDQGRDFEFDDEVPV